VASIVKYLAIVLFPPSLIFVSDVLDVILPYGS